MAIRGHFFEKNNFPVISEGKKILISWKYSLVIYHFVRLDESSPKNNMATVAGMVVFVIIEVEGRIFSR